MMAKPVILNAKQKLAICLILTFVVGCLLPANGAEQSASKAISDKVDKIKSDISQIERDKRRADFDLSLGNYCSECKHTKTEIEAEGENFEQHLKRVNGKAVAASYEMRRAKGAEFDRKLQSLESTLGNLEASHAAAKKRESDERDAARKRERDEREAVRNREYAERKAAEQARENERDARYKAEAQRKREEQRRKAELEATETKIDKVRDEVAVEATAVGRRETVRYNVVRPEMENIRASGETGTSDVTLSQVGGGLKIVSGTGKATQAFMPGPERKLMSAIKDGADIVSSGIEIFYEGQKHDVDGVAASTANMVTSAGKTADRYAGGQYKGEMNKLEKAATVITIIDKATDGDVAGLSVEAVKLAKENLPKNIAPLADRAYDAVDGALEIYDGIQQISDGQTEKARIAERTASTLKNLQEIDDRLKKGSDEARKKIEALIDELTLLEAKKAQLESQSNRPAIKLELR